MGRKICLIAASVVIAGCSGTAGISHGSANGPPSPAVSAREVLARIERRIRDAHALEVRESGRTIDHQDDPTYAMKTSASLRLERTGKVYWAVADAAEHPEAVDDAPQSVLISNGQGVCVIADANTPAETIFRYEANALVETNVETLLLHYGALRPAFGLIGILFPERGIDLRSILEVSDLTLAKDPDPTVSYRVLMRYTNGQSVTRVTLTYDPGSYAIRTRRWTTTLTVEGRSFGFEGDTVYSHFETPHDLPDEGFALPPIKPGFEAEDRLPSTLPPKAPK